MSSSEGMSGMDSIITVSSTPKEMPPGSLCTAALAITAAGCYGNTPPPCAGGGGVSNTGTCDGRNVAPTGFATTGTPGSGGASAIGSAGLAGTSTSGGAGGAGSGAYAGGGVTCCQAAIGLDSLTPQQCDIL